MPVQVDMLSQLGALLVMTQLLQGTTGPTLLYSLGAYADAEVRPPPVTPAAAAPWLCSTGMAWSQHLVRDRRWDADSASPASGLVPSSRPNVAATVAFYFGWNYSVATASRAPASSPRWMDNSIMSMNALKWGVACRVQDAHVAQMLFSGWLVLLT